MDPATPEIKETIPNGTSVFNLNADWTDFYDYAYEEDPPDMPEPLGPGVVTSAFVDSDHTGNVVTRRSHSGIFLFVQSALIKAFSKRQNTVESSTFGSELVEMRICRGMIVELRIIYGKLQSWGYSSRGPF